MIPIVGLLLSFSIAPLSITASRYAGPTYADNNEGIIVICLSELSVIEGVWLRYLRLWWPPRQPSQYIRHLFDLHDAHPLGTVLCRAIRVSLR